jgi:hypothetical protein
VLTGGDGPSGHQAHHRAGTHPPDELQQRQQDVELSFDGDRPERPVGPATAKASFRASRTSGALEDAVEHDEQRGQAADSVQADNAARPGGRNRRGWRGG